MNLDCKQCHLIKLYQNELKKKNQQLKKIQEPKKPTAGQTEIKFGSN